jgi:hypothetical protein
MMSNASYGRPYPQPNYRNNSYPSNCTPPDDRSVDTNQAIGWAARYDANQDGRLNKIEIQTAAVAAEQVDQTLAELFHTFISGGKTGDGLPPDVDGDGMVGFDELVDLGNQVDEGGPTPYSRISAADFKKGFPGQTVDGGNDVYPGQNNSSQGGLQQMVMKLMMSLLQMLIQPQQQQSYQPDYAYPTDAYASDPFAGLY